MAVNAMAVLGIYNMIMPGNRTVSLDETPLRHSLAMPAHNARDGSRPRGLEEP